jgi:hypothetical protein
MATIIDKVNAVPIFRLLFIVSPNLPAAQDGWRLVLLAMNKTPHLIGPILPLARGKKVRIRLENGDTRQREDKATAATRLIFDPDTTVMGFDSQFAKGKAQTRAAYLSATLIGVHKAVKNLLAKG